MDSDPRLSRQPCRSPNWQPVRRSRKRAEKGAAVPRERLPECAPPVGSFASSRFKQETRYRGCDSRSARASRKLAEKGWRTCACGDREAPRRRLPPPLLWAVQFGLEPAEGLAPASLVRADGARLPVRARLCERALRPSPVESSREAQPDDCEQESSGGPRRPAGPDANRRRRADRAALDDDLVDARCQPE